MPNTDPRVDAYIAKAAEFARPLLTHLRKQVHLACPEAEETIKWGMPYFMLNGKILAGMAAFKAHCTFGFRHGEAAAEARKDEAMGQYGRLSTLADLPAPRSLQTQIKRAAKLLEEGVKPVRKAPARPALEAPDDLLSALASNASARQTFEAFSPGKRRDYIEWIIEAKRPDTRAKRLAQSIEWLAEGKTRHWKYENC
jgi:uncharacterized protein YdeI (YjbR/CyaY-like superfamily)